MCSTFCVQGIDIGLGYTESSHNTTSHKGNSLLWLTLKMCNLNLITSDSVSSAFYVPLPV